MLALQAGEVDRIVPMNLDQAQTDQLQGDEYLLAPQQVAGSTTTLSFNTSVAPFDNADVRRALYQAIDREVIGETAYNGNATPAHGPVPEDFEWAANDIDLYTCSTENLAFTNPSGMCDAEAQAGWDQAAGSVDRAVRSQGLERAEQRAEELMYVTPIVTIYPEGVIRQDKWNGIDGFQSEWGGNIYDWTALSPAAS